MYELVLAVISAGDFDLVKLLRKIDIYHLEDKLTDEQRESLIAQAREKADPHNSYAAWQVVADEMGAMIASIRSDLDVLTARVSALEASSGGGGGSDPEDPPVENEYPEWQRPTGAHNAYNIGGKCTYNGERYESAINGNVWAPDEYPAGWRKVVG